MKKGTDPVRILVVEDSVAQARFVQQTLHDMTSSAFEAACAADLASALEMLARGNFDLILLDLVLPDAEGIETFKAVQSAYPGLPIIVLSGAGDETTALRAVAEGAQDYLAKNTLSPDLLGRSIRYAMERHRSIEELRRLTLVDELTGVVNRRGLFALGEQHLALARRTGASITVLFVDVDGLKHINDTRGHHVGDRVLAEVGGLLVDTFRLSDVVGRFGGDEFCVVLLDDSTSASVAESRLRSAIEARNAAHGHDFAISCSIGAINHQPGPDSTITGLLSRADQAMYDQKHSVRRPQALVVDDDPAIRFICEELLGGDFDVFVTGSGREAVEIARSHELTVALVDLDLPDLSGSEVVADLRNEQSTSGVPVVVITSDDREATELASFRAGAEAFVMKPIEDAALRRGIDRALRRTSGRLPTP